MEQYYEVVFKHREGYEYVTFTSESGDLVVKSVPVISEINKEKYFVKISAEDRRKVANWLQMQEMGEEYSCKKQFLHYARQAIEKIDYDYWIATLEPSILNGKIYYNEGEKVGIDLECTEWKQKAIEYYPERGSRIAKLTELVMWYVLRIVEDKWTLEYVTEDSSTAGNYHNSPDAFGEMEPSGARLCGGYRDGQGNSYKIVIIDDFSFGLVGGDFYNDGRQRPVAAIVSGWAPPEAQNWGTGVVVLTK